MDKHLGYASGAALAHTLEAIEVEGCHLATVSIAQAKDGRLRRRDAVAVLIYQELIIDAVDRVVQDRLMEADLNVLHQTKGPVGRQLA